MRLHPPSSRARCAQGRQPGRLAVAPSTARNHAAPSPHCWLHAAASLLLPASSFGSLPVVDQLGNQDAQSRSQLEHHVEAPAVPAVTKGHPKQQGSGLHVWVGSPAGLRLHVRLPTMRAKQSSGIASNAEFLQALAEQARGLLTCREPSRRGIGAPPCGRSKRAGGEDRRSLLTVQRHPLDTEAWPQRTPAAASTHTATETRQATQEIGRQPAQQAPGLPPHAATRASTPPPGQAAAHHQRPASTLLPPSCPNTCLAARLPVTKALPSLLVQQTAAYGPATRPFPSRKPSHHCSSSKPQAKAQ